jgi:hypothetical protein
MAGPLDWGEYVKLANQPELNSDFNRTIGALTGHKVAPDRGRDVLVEWE